MERKPTLLAPFYGVMLLGRERENISCFRAFDRLGLDVRVIGNNREKGGGEAGMELQNLGYLVDLLPFGSHFSVPYFLKIRGYWRRQIVRIAKCSKQMTQLEQCSHQPIIFLGGTMEFLFLFPWLFRTKAPIILRLGDLPEPSLFQSFIYRRCLRIANLIVPCSQAVAERCVSLEPAAKQKIVVIPNCLPHRDENPTNESPARPLQLNDAELRVVFVGQITQKKGIEELMQAMRQLQKLPIHLDVVGGSSWTEEYEKDWKAYCEYHQLKVSWKGYHSNPLPFLHSADVHVAPSTYEEPFGLVVVEAKSAGVPSIVFPSGGMKHLINPETDGWVCHDKTSESLCQSLEKALRAKQSGQLNMMGMNAMDDYKANYTFDKFCCNWNDVLSARFEIGVTR